MNRMVSIGDRLREERVRLGLTQPVIGEMGGITKKTQMLYEGGERAPGADYLAAVADHGVDVRYVLTGKRDHTPAPAISADEQVMLQYFREAAPAVRKAALGALIGASPASAAKSSAVRIGNIEQNSSHDGSVQVGYAGGKVSVKTGKTK